MVRIDKDSVRDDYLTLLAQAFDAEADGLAGAEEDGRLAAHADAAMGCRW